MIKEPSLKRLIENIEKLGNKLIILDGWDINNSPVVITILIENLSKRFVVSLGSFPVFEIALERCLTEMYQNILELNWSKHESDQVPWKQDSKDMSIRFLSWYREISSFPSINEEIFKRLSPVEELDQNWLTIKDDPSVEDIYNYWISHISKSKKIVFYRETSHLKNLYSMNIIEPEKNSLVSGAEVFPVIKESDINSLLIIRNKIKDLVSTISGQEYNFEKFFSLYIQTSGYNTVKSFLCNRLFFYQSDLFIPLNSRGNIYDIFDLIKKYTEGVRIVDYIDDLYMPYLKKYMFISDYSKTGKYSFEEIRDIGKILNYDITKDNLNNINKYKYLIEHIVYGPLRAFYHSKEYEYIVKSFKK